MTTLPSRAPDLRLFGKVDQSMLSEFFRQQSEAPAEGPLVLELSSQGGDADIGRRIAQELRLWQQQGREIFFFGKSYVYSAGVTVMSALPADHRFLTQDCELLIHERKMDKLLTLDGALRSCRAKVNDVLAEIESGERLQHEGFCALVKGSKLTAQQVEDRVHEKDWYLTAQQAVEHGLVAGII